VVFNPSDTYIEMTGNTEALIKRIVAVGGDTIEVKDKKVYVNGVLQKEEYISEDADYTLAPLTVPAGYCVVFGDNRNRSFDSHVWGFLPEKNIIGRAVLKYWPPWRAGFVEGSM
jgi:signal peptidase I